MSVLVLRDWCAQPAWVIMKSSFDHLGIAVEAETQGEARVVDVIVCERVGNVCEKRLVMEGKGMTLLRATNA
jgi:hypothetical protein